MASSNRIYLKVFPNNHFGSPWSWSYPGSTRCIVMEMLAGDCHAWHESLHIKESVVRCGLSKGGYVSLAFYRLFPSQVAGMILAAPRANADTTDTRKNRQDSTAMLPSIQWKTPCFTHSHVR